MKVDKVFVLTAKIKSGKTTAVLKWSQTKNAVGLLQPVENKVRFFIDLYSGEKIKLSADDDEKTPIIIGDYRFSKSAFEKGKQILKEAQHLEADWIIVDEYGKLELDGKGLEPAVSELIEFVKKNDSKKLLVIVRDYLFEGFLKKQNLSFTDVFIINSPEKLFYI